MLSKDLINEFQAILHEEFGLELSAPDADQAANALLSTFKTLSGIRRQSLVRKHDDDEQP